MGGKSEQRHSELTAGGTVAAQPATVSLPLTLTVPTAPAIQPGLGLSLGDSFCVVWFRMCPRKKGSNSQIPSLPSAGKSYCRTPRNVCLPPATSLQGLDPALMLRQLMGSWSTVWEAGSSGLGTSPGNRLGLALPGCLPCSAREREARMARGPRKRRSHGKRLQFQLLAVDALGDFMHFHEFREWKLPWPLSVTLCKSARSCCSFIRSFIIAQACLIKSLLCPGSGLVTPWRPDQS